MRPILTTLTLTLTAAVFLATGPAQASVFLQQFDLGASNDGARIDSLSGFSGGTSTIKYENGSGLSYPGLNPAATGGAAVYDFDGNTGNRSVSEAMSLDFGDFGAGQVFEFSALMRVERAEFNSASIKFDAGSVVNDVSFGVDGTNLFVTAWFNGAETTVTGPAWQLNTTHAFLMRVTQGTGSSPTDSLVEIWFDPDHSNLGTADVTSTSDTRIGRSGAGNAFTTVVYGGNGIGDARVIFDEAEVFAIPEPASLALLGLGSLCMLGGRSRRA